MISQTMSSGAYDQLSGRGQKKRQLLGQESFTQKSPYFSPAAPRGREIPTQLKSSCLPLDKREGKPGLLSHPCQEVAKSSLNCRGQTAAWAG